MLYAKSQNRESPSAVQMPERYGKIILVQAQILQTQVILDLSIT
jgi:hypothetical protein